MQAFGEVLGAPVWQFVVGNNGVVCSSPAHCRTDGIRRTGGAIRAFDNAGVGFGKIFNAFARTGGKNGCGNADERNAVQMFFHGINSVSKGRLKAIFQTAYVGKC